MHFLKAEIKGKVVIVQTCGPGIQWIMCTVLCFHLCLQTKSLTCHLNGHRAFEKIKHDACSQTKTRDIEVATFCYFSSEQLSNRFRHMMSSVMKYVSHGELQFGECTWWIALVRCPFKTCLFKMGQLLGLHVLLLAAFSRITHPNYFTRHWLCRVIETLTLKLKLANTSLAITSAA